MHRALPRPPLRATPKALRCGRGSLLCMTGISPNQRTMRGRDWTRKGGRNWKRFDTLNGVDVDFAKTVAILITSILTTGVAPRLVAVAPSWQAPMGLRQLQISSRSADRAQPAASLRVVLLTVRSAFVQVCTLEVKIAAIS